MIKLGDKVRFVNEDMQGVVTSIKGNTAGVTIEDDFEIPVLINEVVKINDILNKPKQEDDDEETKEPLKTNEFYATYNLEDYTIPAVIRKLLKTTKRFQVRTVRCSRKDKLTDHLDDINGVFSLEKLE